jgi:hypothetical protein
MILRFYILKDNLLREVLNHRKPPVRLRFSILIINYFDNTAIIMPIEIGWWMPVAGCQLPDTNVWDWNSNLEVFLSSNSQSVYQLNSMTVYYMNSWYSYWTSIKQIWEHIRGYHLGQDHNWRNKKTTISVKRDSCLHWPYWEAASLSNLPPYFSSPFSPYGVSFQLKTFPYEMSIARFLS